jgi:hypothetical protein
LQTCSCIGLPDIQSILTEIKAIADEPDNVKELTNRDNLPENEKFQIATVTQE